MVNRVMRFFYEERLLCEDELSELDPELLLLETGIIDSLNVLKLISYLEEEFSVKIFDEELIPDNFASPRAICDLLGRKGCLPL